MSFFQKMLASVGIGAAKVDTILSKEEFYSGELVKGAVEIKGGEVAQRIDAIYLSLYATYEKETDDKLHTTSAVIHKVLITESLSINANEEKSIPFSFRLPNDTPLTMGKTNVWLATGLDIKKGIDPKDTDYIEIKPNALVEKILSSVSELGFRLKSVECKEASYAYRNRLPFIQEFEFKPLSGPFSGRLDELEIMFLSIEETVVELLLQVDRRARGLGGLFAEALEMDESFVPLTISTNDLPNIKQKLQATIEKNA